MESVEEVQTASDSGRDHKPRLPISHPSPSWIGRVTPSERIVSGLFLTFVALSFAVFSLGRPYGIESLRYSSIYAGFWLVWMAAVIRIRPESHRMLRGLRNIGPWLAVMMSYDLVRYLIPALHPGQLDAFLRGVETNWGMGDPGWVHILKGHPAWTDFFSATYLSLFVWMILYAAYYAFVDEKRQQRFMIGFVLIYIGGFLGYILCPATGPRYAYAGEWLWLSGGFFYGFCNQAISGMGAKLDVFPSLHAALSIYLLAWQVKFHPRNLFWGVPLIGGIWLSTIFLGFHYAPDLAAGGVLGIASFWAAPKFKRRLKVPAQDYIDFHEPSPIVLAEGGQVVAEKSERTLYLLERAERIFFGFSSQLTKYFPKFGVWLFDKVVFPPLANRYLIESARRNNRRIIEKVRSFERILVVSDMHIGDAIYIQPAISAIRDFLPDSRVDYAVHAGVAPLIEGNPEISRVLRVFNGKMLPSDSDLSRLRTLLRDGDYDVIFNFSPFLTKAGAYRVEQPLLDVNTFASELSRDLLRGDVPNHFLHQVNAFVRNQLCVRLEPKRTLDSPKVRIYLTASALQQAGEWLFNTQWRPPRPLVFLNPDGASPYTRIPEQFQLQILRGLVGMGAFVLLSKGRTDLGIGVRLRESLTATERNATAMVPDWWPLETFAALIDFADLFISGDTGPLHIAAAWKNVKDGKNGFVNRTSVFSVFGATPSRMSGYDHFQPGYVPANQDAESHTFVSESPCRNITCLNKMMKTCEHLRCFESLDTQAILSTAGKVLAGKRRWPNP